MRDTRAETNEGPRRRAEGNGFHQRHANRNQNCWIRMWTNRNEFVILVSSHETGSAWRGFIQWIGSRRWRGESEFRGSVNSNTREWYAPHKIPYRSLGPAKACSKRAREESVINDAMIQYYEIIRLKMLFHYAKKRKKCSKYTRSYMSIINWNFIRVKLMLNWFYLERFVGRWY